jgi:predicted acetyltransferase
MEAPFRSICSLGSIVLEQPHVTLDPAASRDVTLLENLLELYLHDLSEAFPAIEIDANGRVGYDKLALYWSEPERRFPFLIRADGRVAGFVLVTRGSPASDDPDVLDVAEFFVLRRYRRSGVGRRCPSSGSCSAPPHAQVPRLDARDDKGPAEGPPAGRCDRRRWLA